jgi:multisubunit Na+/H+ antiporter MnhB subunit
LYALGCAGIVVFAARFPDDRSDGWRRIVQRVAPPVFIVELTALTWFQIAYFSPLPGLAWTQGIIDGAAEVAITLAFITLVIRYKRSQNAERPILFWMAVAIGIGGLVTCW